MPAIHEATGTVKSVTVEYDVDKTWGSYKPHFDMFLIVEYNDGQSWDKTMEIYGNVKKNLPITDQKSWGSAFKIRTFFESCTGKKNLMMSDGYSLPDDLFDEVIGKQFMVAFAGTDTQKKVRALIDSNPTEEKAQQAIRKLELGKIKKQSKEKETK